MCSMTDTKHSLTPMTTTRGSKTRFAITSFCVGIALTIFVYWRSWNTLLQFLHSMSNFCGGHFVEMSLPSWSSRLRVRFSPWGVRDRHPVPRLGTDTPSGVYPWGQTPVRPLSAPYSDRIYRIHRIVQGGNATRICSIWGQTPHPWGQTPFTPIYLLYSP